MATPMDNTSDTGSIDIEHESVNSDHDDNEYEFDDFLVDDINSSESDHNGNISENNILPDHVKRVRIQTNRFVPSESDVEDFSDEDNEYTNGETTEEDKQYDSELSQSEDEDEDEDKDEDEDEDEDDEDEHEDEHEDEDEDHEDIVAQEQVSIDMDIED
jgi:hypothetical protein